jgi:hypothetical protein
MGSAATPAMAPPSSSEDGLDYLPMGESERLALVCQKVSAMFSPTGPGWKTIEGNDQSLGFHGVKQPKGIDVKMRVLKKNSGV